MENFRGCIFQTRICRPGKGKKPLLCKKKTHLINKIREGGFEKLGLKCLSCVMDKSTGGGTNKPSGKKSFFFPPLWSHLVMGPGADCSLQVVVLINLHTISSVSWTFTKTKLPTSDMTPHQKKINMKIVNPKNNH